MTEWPPTTIGAQATLQRGFDVTRAEQRAGTIPVISSGGISSFHDTAAVRGPGVVLGRKGVVGSVYFVAADYWPHDTTLWVKDFHGNEPRFVYYFFRSLAPRLASLDVGSANPTLNRNHVHPIGVSWPPLSEQRAISSILGALDDKIELNRRMNETLEGLARALFDYAFGDGDTDATLGDLATIERQGLDPQDHLDEWFDHYSLPAFDEGARPAQERGHQIKSNKFVLAPGCVLLSKLNPSIPRVWLPRVSSLRRSIASTEFVVLRPSKSSSVEHLNCLLRTEALREHLIGRASGTSNSHQRVKPDDLLATPVHRPTPDRLARFTGLARPLFERVAASLAEVSTLAETRDTLLPKLLSGELRVRDAERTAKAAT